MSETVQTTLQGEKAGVECEQCGGVFEVPSYREDTARFCSRRCKDDAQTHNQTGPSNPNWSDRVEVQCEECGEAFGVVPSREGTARFCSMVCVGRHRGRTDNPEDHITETECEWCGAELSRYDSQLYEKSFCGPSCQGKWISKNGSGANHPQWEGGRDIYRAILKRLPGPPWYEARRIARESTEGECELCGETPEIKIPVHHIIPIRSGGTNTQELLMTLCSSCHGKVEQYTKQFTTSIIPKQ